MTAPKPVPAAARATKTPEPVAMPAAQVVSTEAAAVATPPGGSNLRAMFANVALVNDVLSACGGVEAFLQHLELVAGIRMSA